MSKNIKMIIIVMIVTLCGFIFGNQMASLGTSLLNSNDKSYSKTEISEGLKFLNELKNFFGDIDIKEDIEVLKVQIANKLYQLANSNYNSNIVDNLVMNLLSILGKSFDSSTSLLEYFMDELTSSISNIGSSINLVLTPDKQVKIESTTAALNSEGGNDYKVNLNSYIYYAEGESTKWVVLVHPYMMNGKLITNSLGEMYLDKGYNVLAPDLRGFGESGGSVAMGYLESLDIWDWLTYINDPTKDGIGNRVATDVIIHGVSLGGATTLQLWTQAGFGRDLTDKNVIGVVDDCGYHSMTGILEGMMSTNAGMELLSTITKVDLYEFVGEDNLKNLLLNVLKVGIKESEFEIKQDALHKSRVTSDVPIYIIHGTADTMVPYSISTSYVYPKAVQESLLYNFWQVTGKPHAFVVIGMDKENYKNRIHEFIDYVEKREPQSVVIPNETISPETNDSSLKALITSIAEIFNTIKSFLNF